jgi:hypothetical protein
VQQERRADISERQKPPAEHQITQIEVASKRLAANDWHFYKEQQDTLTQTEIGDEVDD